jgi:hypothetical protein
MRIKAVIRAGRRAIGVVTSIPIPPDSQPNEQCEAALIQQVAGAITGLEIAIEGQERSSDRRRCAYQLEERQVTMALIRRCS